jgi:hypothetical protein
MHRNHRQIRLQADQLIAAAQAIQAMLNCIN